MLLLGGLVGFVCVSPSCMPRANALLEFIAARPVIERACFLWIEPWAATAGNVRDPVLPANCLNEAFLGPQGISDIANFSDEASCIVLSRFQRGKGILVIFRSA